MVNSLNDFHMLMATPSMIMNVAIRQWISVMVPSFLVIMRVGYRTTR